MLQDTEVSKPKTEDKLGEQSRAEAGCAPIREAKVSCELSYLIIERIVLLSRDHLRQFHVLTRKTLGLSSNTLKLPNSRTSVRKCYA